MQEEIIIKAARKPWSADDDATLQQSAGLGAKTLAVMLGRSDQQIRNRAAKLGVSLRVEGEKRGRKPKVTAEL